MTFKEALQSIEGHLWTSEKETAEFLASLITLTDSKVVVETGVFKGQTSIHLIDALSKGGNYTGIDIEDLREKGVIKYMGERGNAKFIKESSLTALKGIADRSVDLIFMDSNHEPDYVEKEFKTCERVIKQNGIIAMHDTWLPGVQDWIQYIRPMKHFQVIDVPTLDDGTGNHRGLALVKCLMA